MNKIYHLYNNLNDGKKSALIGGIVILLLVTALITHSQRRIEKLKSNYIWVEGTITKIRLNVRKGTTTSHDIFYFEFEHNGKKIIKSQTTYYPELLKVGQKFKIKVHPEDYDLLEFNLKGT